MFFLNAKRLDLELNSAKHIDKQLEWKERNLETHFKGVDRVEVKESLASFKKKMPLHPDIFKANYATFKM